ncbi:M16 family metallopeptidase [Nigerium massiliense]|uniref:M16 family metallopeptidase n=1 Tax=Nigerium massiliense TaxID=1522317 RepID=UPI00058DFB44|nr:pitrilysin family protein [Nigerium massiliense]
MNLRKRPKVHRPRPWRFPRPEEFTLPNGLRVLLYDRPGQHVLSAGLALDLPLTAEPANLEGVAALTVRALDSGTASHPDTAFADAVESCGAVLEGAIGHSNTHLYTDVPAPRIADALALMAEAVAEPQLDDADVDRERMLRLAQIEQQLAHSSERAGHAFRRTILQRRYRAARMKSGEPDTLARVRGEHVRSFHRDFYGPIGSTLVVAGDLDAGITGVVEDAFSGWTNPHQRFVDQEIPQPRHRHLYLIDRPGSVQADVRLGRFTVDRADPAWPNLQIGAHALGGAFLSRLNRELREERGLTYGVHLVNAPMRDGGYSYVQGSFRTEVVAEAVGMLPSLLDVTAKPFSAEEIDRSRDYLTGVQPLQYATASGVCNQVMSLLSAGLTSDYIDALRTGYLHVTPESATEVVATLLPPDDLSLVVVGDAASIAEPLRAAGWPVRVLSQGEWI